MSDRILTDAELDVIPTYHNRGVIAFKVSHRLLAARVKELEAELTELVHSMTHPLRTS